jgi:uncharacterized protein YoxC
MLGVPGQVISETTCGKFRSAARKRPSFYNLFCWALMVSFLLLMVSGCSRYKEELESANQQIQKLNSEVTRLTEEVSRLNQEKTRLSDDSKVVSDKNTLMQETDDLNKAKGALSAETKSLEEKIGRGRNRFFETKSRLAKRSRNSRSVFNWPPPASLPAFPPAAPPTGKQPGDSVHVMR